MIIISTTFGILDSTYIYICDTLYGGLWK